MVRLRLEVLGLLCSTADLDRGDAAQQVDINESPGVGLDRNEVFVDLDRDLNFFEIVRIDPDIDYSADGDPVVLDHRAFAEPGDGSLEKDVVSLEVLRELDAAQRQHRHKAYDDDGEDECAHCHIMGSCFHLLSPERARLTPEPRSVLLAWFRRLLPSAEPPARAGHENTRESRDDCH